MVRLSFDIIFVLPYVFSDHPSFPEGLLKRALESHGFSVGIIEQPFWQSKESFSRLARPNLFFAIISGPMDSMVLNYTSLRKRRREDLYQPDGRAFFEDYPPSIHYKIRPDRTLMVFSNRIRETYKDVPVVIGGLEASLRRFAHYDFQQDKLRRSILLDSRAQLLVYGPGEKQIVDIARNLKRKTCIEDLALPGTAKIVQRIDPDLPATLLPTFEAIQSDPGLLLQTQLLIDRAMHQNHCIVQPHADRYLISYPPASYTSSDLDDIYGLSYTRTHLNSRISSPALQMNRFSITTHRGCGGGCSFCSIRAHEGRRIISRHPDSIVQEISKLTKHPNWKGSISDLGGASVEMYAGECNQKECRRASCLHPDQCAQHSFAKAYSALLSRCRKIKGVKKIFVGSGTRYDVLLTAPDLLEQIMRHHAGRFLRVAPEHTENHILSLMRKPPFERFEAFVDLFNAINRKLKRKIELAAYLIIGHPGENRQDVTNMKNKLRALGVSILDAQVFTPSPGTLSTAMYVSGLSPTLKSLTIPKEIKELTRRKKIIQ